MKKAFAIGIAVILSIVVIMLASLYWVIQSSYATQIVNHLLKRYSDTEISVYQANFQFPNHLSLLGVEINKTKKPIVIEQADIWISFDSFSKSKLILNSVLLNGINLQQNLPDLSFYQSVPIRQLSITNLDFSYGEIISRGTRLQVQQPRFVLNNPLLPYGKIQFSAEQIYWHKEAFNNLLIDLDHKEENSTLHGLSFEWRGADISGQAEQYKGGWSLVNATIDRLNLNRALWSKLEHNDWSIITKHINNINSLDILNSSIETPWGDINNGNLSIENIRPHKTIWQQNDGYISFSADSLQLFEKLWINPTVASHFDNDLVTLKELSVEFEQGLLQSEGELTPKSLHLKRFDVDGVKWIYESDFHAAPVKYYLEHLQELHIDDFSVQRSQFIQLAHTPNWQISGLSIKGKDLTLLQGGKKGLWQGDIRSSASNASYAQLLSNQPLIAMASRNGIWHLNEAIIPLEKGLIEATASYDLNQLSHPWRLELFADGIPMSFILSRFNLTVPIEATTEFQLGIQGLAGDSLMLGHSLTGELAGSLRDAFLQQNFAQEDSNKKKQTLRRLPINNADLAVIADRGRITVKPTVLVGDALKGELRGQIDLLMPKSGEFGLELHYDCTNQTFDFLNRMVDIKNTCIQELSDTIE